MEKLFLCRYKRKKKRLKKERERKRKFGTTIITVFQVYNNLLFEFP